jgi:ligand-binding SRPBCC domain-containing protein
MAWSASLHTEQFIARPREEVFGFFADAANLQRITPPWVHFEIVSRQPVELGEGATIDYRLRIRGAPLRWRSLIAVWDPPHRFVDEQVRGPYRLWRHEHRFEEAPGGTRVIDHIEYRAPGGPLALLITRLLVRPDVERIFAWRQRALAGIFPAPPAPPPNAPRRAPDPVQ